MEKEVNDMRHSFDAIIHSLMIGSQREIALRIFSSQPLVGIVIIFLSRRFKDLPRLTKSSGEISELFFLELLIYFHRGNDGGSLKTEKVRWMILFLLILRN